MVKQKTFNTKTKNRTLRLVYIAIFVALIIVGAFIKFPVGIVPVSMQCAFCILCALILGAKDGAAAVIIYIAMGLVGIPIFTKGGGFAYVLQPTFGYLLGYVFAVPIGALIARGMRNNPQPRLWRLFAGAFAALAIVYFVGVMYMYLMLNYYAGANLDIGKAWLTGCAVFLPTDCMWCVVASLIAWRILPRMSIARQCIMSSRRNLQYEEYMRDASSAEDESVF